MSNVTYKFLLSDYSEYMPTTKSWAYKSSPTEKDEEINSPELIPNILFEAQKKLAENNTLSNIIANKEGSNLDTQGIRLFEIIPKSEGAYIKTYGLVGAVRIEDLEFESTDDNSQATKKFNVEITVTSRFDTDKEKPFFLSYMLSFETPKLIDYKPRANDEKLLEILLLYLFKNGLQEAYRQGAFKAYQRFERNDNRLKGPIDIQRHIKDNIPFNISMAYNSREYTYNNNVNFLILHAYEQLKRRFPKEVQSFLIADREFMSIINAIKESASGFFTSDITKVVSKCLRPISHPYFQKYEALRLTCLKILRHMGLSVFNGENEKVKGVLIYIPGLWENFLLKRFENHKIGTNYALESQDEMKIFRVSGLCCQLM